MNKETISAALLMPTLQECVAALVPPEDEDTPIAPIKDSFYEVKVLRAQRDQLTGIWPDRATKFNDQFNAEVAKVAAKLYEEILGLKTS